jgi:hypothetical protein
VLDGVTQCVSCKEISELKATHCKGAAL